LQSNNSMEPTRPAAVKRVRDSLYGLSGRSIALRIPLGDRGASRREDPGRLAASAHRNGCAAPVHPVRLRRTKRSAGAGGPREPVRRGETAETGAPRRAAIHTR
jgi:hypothetical protein